MHLYKFINIFTIVWLIQTSQTIASHLSVRYFWKLSVIWIKYLTIMIVAFCIPAEFKHISKRIKPNKLNIRVMANEIMLAQHIKFKVCLKCCLIILYHLCRISFQIVLEKSFVASEFLVVIVHPIVVVIYMCVVNSRINSQIRLYL